MHKLTEFAIKKSRVTFAFLFLIAFFGFLSYQKLSKREDPGFTIRTARVTTFFPGASPERVETLITDKVEKAVQEIPEIDYILSESRTGASIVTLQVLDKYKNVRPIWDNFRRKIEKVSPFLPEGIEGPFIDDEFGDVFGIIISLTADGFNYQQMKEIADQLKDELLFLEEIAKVEIFGAQEEKIFIEFKDAKLSEFGISPHQLRQMFKETNMIHPGGSLTTKSERIIVEPTGNFETLNDLENMVFTLPGQSSVFFLKDLADVKRSYTDPPLHLVHTNGKPSISLAIAMQEGGNILSLGKKVKNLMTKMEEEYPLGIDFTFTSFQPEEVQKKVHDFLENLLQSVSIVILVMLLTLGLRTGLIVAGLIPFTIAATFIIMAFFHIGIDQISLAALIISLGILVDNAIVIAESVLSEVQNGKSIEEASILSSKELNVSLFTSSFTTSLAFLPIFLSENITGEYTAPLFYVVTISLFSSWILSLTMIPVFLVFFFKIKKRKISKISFFMNLFSQKYRFFLSSLLRYKITVLSIFFLFFGLSLFSFQWIPKSFFPPSDRNSLTLDIQLPSGTKIEKTKKVVDHIDEYLAKNWWKKDLINWSSFIGGGAPRYVINYTPEAPNAEKAYLMMNLASSEKISTLSQTLDQFLEENFPEAIFTLKKPYYGPPVKTPIAIRVSGKEQEALFSIVNEIKKSLKKTNGIKNVRDNWGEKSKKILVSINQTKALRAKISNKDVATSLQTSLSGFEASLFRENESVIPIILRSTDSERNDLDRFETLLVRSQTTGASVPLKQIADINWDFQTNKIFRRNRLKTVTIEADLDKGFTAKQVNASFLPSLNEMQKSFPSGYFYDLGGEEESANAASKAIEKKIPLTLLLIALVFIIQFNSFRLSLIILLTIPLGLIGVVIGLFVTSSYFGFMTLLGIVSLSGILINNAIVLLDRIGVEKSLGKSPKEAVLDASLRRLRPIFLTTLTTICGLIPLWFGGGAMFSPMAVTIIFGLFFATLLTLGFVPILYTLFYRIR